MARKGKKKDTYDTSEAFLEYQEEIVNDDAYKGMPDLRYEDGTIQWEAPSNRASGVFKDSHDKRLAWWKEKAKSLGISDTESKWISKTAKKIHPTGYKPCKYCGKIMDIRYSYLSSDFINRVYKLDFVTTDFKIDSLTYVFDFITSFIDTYGTRVYKHLPELFKCKQYPKVEIINNNVESWVEWLNDKYIPTEPSMLSPGAMANPPDRLDGFHSFNRCCRSNKDKGRSKENLQSYSSDRRAFENWVDGNWITANKLMGYINSDSHIKKEKCANYKMEGTHSRPCSADHIGPISLGFAHRPEFQLLCASCNSSKNNRMYYSDVLHLRLVESKGIVITTWYSKPIWDLINPKVTDKNTALRLSRIMRDNRHIAMSILADFFSEKFYIFLLSFLNLQYADYEYKFLNTSISNHIVSATFEKHKSNLKYVLMQKARKTRVAFESLKEYHTKDNRNGFTISTSNITQLTQSTFLLLATIDQDLLALNQKLIDIIDSDISTDEDLISLLREIPFDSLISNPIIQKAKDNLIEIMTIVATELNSMWDDPRYSRE